MKKTLAIFMGAILLMGCSKSDDNSDQNFKEYSDHFVYYGVKYPIVKMKDGRTWMAKNLSYLPEGITPSDDASVDAGVWYPYTGPATDAKTKVTKGNKDPKAVEENGYLYSYEVALQTKITKDNLFLQEGKQGICPKGWHIPTRAEYLKLLGYSIKIGDEAADIINDKSPYYSKAAKGATIPSLNKDNFNWKNWSYRNDKGTYFSMGVKPGEAPAEYMNGLKSTQLICSSGAGLIYNKKTNELMNIQFLGAMGMFVKTFPEGRVFLSKANYKFGYPLRCIKDK